MTSPATGPVGLVLEGQLRQLLFTALFDGTIYSALVPWVLDSDHKGLTLLQHAQERQCLQHVQLQAGQATPQDMQHCVLQVIAEACHHAAGLLVDACSQAAAGACADAEHRGVTLQPSATSSSKQQPTKQLCLDKADSSSCTSCSLSQPASRLAKLHGHLLSHLAAPNLADRLHQLLLLLTAGPLDSATSVAAAGKQTASNSKPGTGKQAKGSPHVSAPAASKPALQQADDGSPAQQASAAATSPQQLLPCRACAARYAAKALECCSKLLSCMPCELQQALVSSRHLQHYSPALVTLLTKSLASGAGSNAAGNTGSLPPAATPWQQQHQGHAAADHTPASAGASSAGRPGVLGWAAAGTPGSACSGGAAWLTDAQRSLPGSGSKGGARQANRTPASARLSGLGLLMPNTPGTGLASRPASAGQLPAGGKAAKTAAVCNREKSRDMFFTILRRASSRLDTMRNMQETAAAAAGEGVQQATAAEAAAAADMAELLSEVGVAAKQLLLQLAPSNLGYLAELFMACVLQAASTGEPLLEPALVMIAEKDPSRFQKLQQRLGHRPAGTAMAPSPGVAATPGGGGSSSSSNRQAARTGPGSGKQQQQQQQQQRQAAKQAGQQQVALQQRVDRELGADSLVAGKSDGLVHVMHVRARDRPAKQAKQQPHILATAGAAASAHAMAAANGPSNGTAQKQPAHSRHIIPQASTAQHSQPQHGSARQQQVGKAGAVHSNGYMSAASPVPLVVAGAADSPLPASCLSPLFAAASDYPLTAVTAPGLARGAAARHCGSPLIKNSSSNQTGLVAPTALPSSKLSGSGAQQSATQQGTSNGSSLVTPAARVPFVAAASTAGPQKPGAATALAKGSRPPSGAAAGGSGPHSAPPKLQAALVGSSTAGTGAAAVLAQHGPGPAQVMLQCLELMPAGQHVLVLLLHAADSSSFNRALLGVMCSRVEKLLCSSPASFTAASGLGQQASAIVALGSYCGYLAFAAGAAEVETAGAAAQGEGGQLLQQQPLLDIATMLQRVLASAASCSAGGNTELQQAPGGSELDAAWRLALAVPFTVSCMRLAEMNPAAANSPCMQAALQTLQAFRRLPALGPTTPGFGALPICVGCCIQSCHLSQLHPAAATDLMDSISSVQGELSLALGSGSCLVDSLYWSICCPGLQQLIALLNAAAAAASASPIGPVSLSASALRAQQQRQRQQQEDDTPGRTAFLQDVAVAGASGKVGTGQSIASCAGDASRVSKDGSSADTAEQTPRATTAAAVGAKSHSSTSSSPAGAAAARHTTPLLLAPRAPPEVPSPPAVMLDALAAVSDPVRQQLQQACISQYSTDDNPVKMRDVLTVINGILFANSLSKALSQGLPGVLQKHLDLLQQAVQQQLAPATQGHGGGSTTQLQGQDLARAVHALYTDQLSAALPEALEAAMQAASHHACQAAAAACGALLPADVPSAAATTAAAMVTASCKASCAQRLLQEVPVLVQSTLADAADDLVRLVNRQWAVHARMTAGATAGPALGAVPRTDSSSSIKSNSASGVAAKQPTRLQPVKLDSAAAAAGTLTAAVCSDAAATTDVQGTGAGVSQTVHMGVSNRLAAPAESQAAGGDAGIGAGATSDVCKAAADADNSAAAEGLPPVVEPQAAANAGCASAAATKPAAFAQTSGTIYGTGTEPAKAGSTPAGIITGYVSAQLAACSELQDRLQGDQGVAKLTLAAQAAGQQLVQGFTNGVFSMLEVEQQLIQALQHVQSASPGPHSTASTAAALKAKLPGDLQQVSLQQLEEQLLLLLAGALMHALLCCPKVKASVWAVEAAGSEEAGARGAVARPAGSCLPQLTQLPALLMKAARGDMPVWLLRQLRVWMQQATLGCH